VAELDWLGAALVYLLYLPYFAHMNPKTTTAISRNIIEYIPRLNMFDHVFMG